MIIAHPTYSDEVNLRCAVYDGSVWVEVLGVSTQLSATRGGTVGIAGIASVDVGTMSVNILDAFDPTQTSLLAPNRPIVVYVGDITSPIFTGTVQDISTNYFYESGKQHVNIVVYAVDAVSSHAGITVPGFTGTTLNGVANAADGYQRWEDRINDLSAAYAQADVPAVVISGPVPIYSI
jgi:hypothetical protein